MSSGQELHEGVITQRVITYAEEKRVGFEKLSAAVGVNERHAIECMKGKRTLSAEEYVFACDLLDVPYSQFIEGSDY